MFFYTVKNKKDENNWSVSFILNKFSFENVINKKTTLIEEITEHCNVQELEYPVNFVLFAHQYIENLAYYYDLISA
tara:strand:+ start:632 stop:859 length:228 start_codon:yes stop_codon:yes gene_type:complete